MITITIDEDTKTKQDMVYALERIAMLIEEGYTSGYEPSWQLSGDEETENDADDYATKQELDVANLTDAKDDEVN